MVALGPVQGWDQGRDRALAQESAREQAPERVPDQELARGPVRDQAPARELARARGQALEAEAVELARKPPHPSPRDQQSALRGTTSTRAPTERPFVFRTQVDYL